MEGTDPEAEGARLLSAANGQRCAPGRSPPARLLAALRNAWRAEPLLLATLAGVAAGILLGVALSFASLPPLALDVIGLPGDLLMRTLKMLVLPLITASVMAGVCALRASTADMGKVARYTLLYYFTTTMGAVILGIAIVNIVRPGRGAPFDQLDSGSGGCHAANRQAVAQHAAATGQHSPGEAFLGVIKSAFPDNVFAAAVNMNVLGIITVSLLMGAALSSMGPPAAPLVELVNVFNDAIAKIVNWVIWTSPVGIASLITASICRACNLGATLAALGLFVLAVLLGLAVWGFLVLPAIYYASTRRNPGQVYRGFSQAMATAFGTDSSNATLPITMRSAVENLGCDPRVVQFFLPLGTTVNMNGTALYEAVTVIFIAQAHGVALGAAGTVIVALTATLAAVGAAGIPSAGLVTMLMVLQAVELEQFAGDIAIILAVDWFLDRCRTVINVLGDSFGTVIIDHHARKWVVPGPHPPPPEAGKASFCEDLHNGAEKRATGLGSVAAGGAIGQAGIELAAAPLTAVAAQDGTGIAAMAVPVGSSTVAPWDSAHCALHGGPQDRPVQGLAIHPNHHLLHHHHHHNYPRGDPQRVRQGLSEGGGADLGSGPAFPGSGHASGPGLPPASAPGSRAHLSEPELHHRHPHAHAHPGHHPQASLASVYGSGVTAAAAPPLGATARPTEALGGLGS